MVTTNPFKRGQEHNDNSDETGKAIYIVSDEEHELHQVLLSELSLDKLKHEVNAIDQQGEVTLATDGT